MKSERITQWLSVAALLGTCGTVAAQGAAPAPNAGEAPTVTLRSNAGGSVVTVNASNQPLEAVLRDAATQANTRIWVEPDISQPVNATLNRRPIEEVLRTLTGEQGPYWAKVEILHRSNEPVPEAGLYDLVRAFHALPSDRMAVGLAGGAGSVTLSRGGADLTPPSPMANLNRVVGYVVAKRSAATAPGVPVATGDEAVDRYSQTNMQRYELMQQMGPEQRSKALQQDLLYMMQLSPEARQQLRQDMRNAWRTLPDDVRQQLRQNRGGGGFGGGGRRGNRGGNRGGAPANPG